MIGAAADHVEATVRVAIRRFNEYRDSGSHRNGDRAAGRGRFAVNEIAALDGHVLAIGEWEEDPGNARGSMPLVLSWRFAKSGEVAGIEAFACRADADAAARATASTSPAIRP